LLVRWAVFEGGGDGLHVVCLGCEESTACYVECAAVDRGIAEWAGLGFDGPMDAYFAIGLVYDKNFLFTNISKNDSSCL
jgi:hypothetical protein